ncbi:MAG: ADP-ribosylglycohydrolase family protein [Actinobacteria bacterium]|nr:ADP-ribosylglycohydrolase family protein [Actinomycetota bacterium]
MDVDRFRGALVGLALGDALGAPYEFKAPPFTVEAEFREGVFGTLPGHPTDDSTLAVFVAEAVLEAHDWPAGYTRRLVAWMQSGPPDIGNQTRRAAQRWAAGTAPVPDEAAQGNGSLMAVTPVVLRFASDRERARSRAADFARLTHPSDAAAATNAQFADALLDVLAGGEPPAIGEARRPAHGRGMGWCELCLDLAFLTWHRAKELGPFPALLELIALGGDTDTNAAVAGALLGAGYGTTAWPDNLVAGLHLAPRMADLAFQLYESARSP